MTVSGGVVSFVQTKSSYIRKETSAGMCMPISWIASTTRRPPRPSEATNDSGEHHSEHALK